jgi:hypothetical protein
VHNIYFQFFDIFYLFSVIFLCRLIWHPFYFDAKFFTGYRIYFHSANFDIFNPLFDLIATHSIFNPLYDIVAPVHLLSS